MSDYVTFRIEDGEIVDAPERGPVLDNIIVVPAPPAFRCVECGAPITGWWLRFVEIGEGDHRHVDPMPHGQVNEPCGHVDGYWHDPTIDAPESQGA